MKIPFDIKYRPQIESGEYKVETRDGRPARIICWDAKGYRPIIVLAQDGDNEKCIAIRENGDFDSQFEHIYDLFIITNETELTSIAKALSNYLTNDFEFFATKNWDEKMWNEVMNTQAAELLELAKKEICKGCSANLEGYIKGRQDTLKEIGNYMQQRFTMENPNIQKLDPNVVIDTTTSGTCKKD